MFIFNLFTWLIIEFIIRLSNEAGTIAMARTSDIDSANTEYFFNLGNNAVDLGQIGDNPGYTAFGEVAVGYELLVKMSELPVITQGTLHFLKEKIPVTISLEG